MSKMFPFITQTWNPLGGECIHGCSYCWAQKMAKQYAMKKYIGSPRLFKKELERTFKKTDFVFVCDMTDWLAEWVPEEEIQTIIDIMASSEATFLSLTKNPGRYGYFKWPKNVVLGCTIETNRNDPIIGYAPCREYRMSWMDELFPEVENQLFLSIEPILDFDLESFALHIAKIHPKFVAIGYDNYNNGLPEPSLAKTLHLIALLEDARIKVYRKTLRDPLTISGKVTK
jgi:hypothetical protein